MTTVAASPLHLANADTEPAAVQTSWAHLDVPRDEIVMQINIYNESITLTTHREGRSQVRMVDPDAIAHALSRRITYRSPVLKGDALWWQVGKDGSTLGLWREPCIKRVALQVKAFEPPERYTLPMPGMVFACTPGRPPRVFAAKCRPDGPEAPLYHAPTFNTYADGRVCPGNHKFPQEPAEIPDSFFVSLFSETGQTNGRSHSHPDSLQNLWAELDGQAEYPLDDLVFACQLQEVMAS